MRDETERDRQHDGRRDAASSAPKEAREGGLRDILRRIVGPREQGVYVMDPDGKVRKG